MLWNGESPKNSQLRSGHMRANDRTIASPGCGKGRGAGMNTTLLDEIVNAVLYEGYLLRDMKPAEEFFNPDNKIECPMVNGVEIKPGDKVRICPKSRADAFDFMLAGKTAIVEAVERDVEDKIHLAVVMEDDPGKDLGLMRQPGHRFFYGLDEIELLKESTI
jgi:hypothetical protein